MGTEKEDGDSDLHKVSVEASPSAVNKLILDYYKKFGRKRDLEQFFSLCTAQSEIRDPTGTFWRKMKSQNDSSDSGEKKSESSTELCRISIKCSIPEPPSFHTRENRDYPKSDSESPPIITEETAPGTANDSDGESAKSDAHSQRSNDATLDTSMNKPHSPTSSIISQRKLEWDSLADVGYANESDRKNSASSLSTLERLALKQQYSHNDSRQNVNIGAPTSHSTPVEETENKSKGKKGLTKKTTKIYQKDVDYVELNVPSTSQTSLAQAISVNLSKHISFNVEKDGEISFDNIKRNISVSPNVEKDVEFNTDNTKRESVSPDKVEGEKQMQDKLDKEIQTSLIRNRDKSTSLSDAPQILSLNAQRFPVLINLNSLKNRNRRRKLRTARKKLRNKNKVKVNEKVLQEKTTEQISEAESFEYMPGHIYNQNHINQHREANVGNKSSLESSAGQTTDSSKVSKYSFTKDLEKGIDLLKTVLKQNNNDSTLKKKLIKEVVQRLIKSKYKDDESSTDFLSGLSFSSKTGLSEENHTTTSTSDANIHKEKTKLSRPKKSILRTDKFNSNAIASTSQSAPNLLTMSNVEKPVPTKPIFFSNTDSDISQNEMIFSDKEVAKTTSEELYRKYLEALRREQAYKKHLKDKEDFLKQKLISSDTAVSQIVQADVKARSKLKSLLNDLTRNNYDDGSGDASKLEGHWNSDINMGPYAVTNKQRSHSVFTLSSGNFINKNKNVCSKNRNKDGSRADKIKQEQQYCHCPHHTVGAKVDVADSSVQVNIKSDIPSTSKPIPGDKPELLASMSCKKESPRKTTDTLSDSETTDLKYVCMCAHNGKASHKVPEKYLIYKCSQLVNKSVQLDDNPEPLKTDNGNCMTDTHQCRCNQGTSPSKEMHQRNCNVLGNRKDKTLSIPLSLHTKSSQTEVNFNIMQHRKASVKSVSSQSGCAGCGNDMAKPNDEKNVARSHNNSPKVFVHEAVRSAQTEITINPRLSDPSLSDINIIEDKDCVEVIKEQYRPISNSSTENNTIDHTSEKGSHVSSGSSSTKVINKNDAQKSDQEKCNVQYDLKPVLQYPTSACNIQLQTDKDVQYDLKPVDAVQNINYSDQFTIPIQGTNMTLKVNLGTNSGGMSSKTNTIQSQGVGTDRMEVVEQFTSLRDDCTKAVQCTDSNIFQNVNKVADVKLNEKCDKSNEIPINANYSVNPCSLNTRKFDTYPKEIQGNVRKSFLRTNTDVSNFETVDTLQLVKELRKYNKSEKSQKPENCGQVECCGKRDEISDNFEQLTKSSPLTKEKSCIDSLAKSSKADDMLKKGEATRNESNIPSSDSETPSEFDTNKDPILDLIQNITKRYSKKDIERSKKKKCFKEIMTFLNYLLDTEDSTEEKNKNSVCGNSSCGQKDDKTPQKEKNETEPHCLKTFVDKGVQLSMKKDKSKKLKNTESSENAVSTEFPTTSTDSATCRVITRIKKECEKYHQKRCKSHTVLNNCETSSTTSINCVQCRKVHYCHCIRNKCRNHKGKAEKPKKRCVAYNLILQTSDSVVSEENVGGCGNRVPLKSIIVKVPSKKRQFENVPFREMAAKFERNVPQCSPNRDHRSKSLPNESEISSTDEFLRKAQTYTVREYLERNRPDFVEKSSKRHDSLKFINETRPKTCNPYYKMIVVHAPKCAPNTCLDTCGLHCGGASMSCNPCDPHVHIQSEVRRNANERHAKRQLLSLQLARQQTLSAMTDEELRYFAKQLSEDLRRKKVAPKFINEREMKKHSENIYKSLPEVTRKKEEVKKENIKKTNLLMAQIFKKNLQKKTLRGSVNLSNYSPVIKI